MYIAHIFVDIEQQSLRRVPTRDVKLVLARLALNIQCGVKGECTK
jgi:hypothetical protein